MAITVQDGGIIDPALSGLKFESTEGVDAMRELLDKVAESKRDFGLFETTSYTKEEAIEELRSFIDKYLHAIDKASCLTNKTPVLTKYFVGAVESRLSSYDENNSGLYNYWEIEALHDSDLYVYPGLREDMASNCLIIESDTLGDDGLVCSAATYAKTINKFTNYSEVSNWVFSCGGLKNCGGNIGGGFSYSPPRCK